MAGLPHSASTLAFKTDPAAIAAEIREGDWSAYKQYSSQCSNKNMSPSKDNLTVYRRQCALAYLGKRAQFYGGACNKIQPRILTPRFIMELDATNKTRRFERYPWLEKMINLIAEIERDQDKISTSNNIISLMSASK
jgi:hypothetical protein